MSAASSVAAQMSRSTMAQSIVMSSTTSTEQSGLFAHLLPAFKKVSGLDVKVVALGTGAPEQQMAKLTQIGMFMQQGAATGMVTSENMYNWGKEFLRVAGYRSPDKFLTKPDPQKPPAQSPPPEVQAAQIQVQGLAQVEQIKQQGKQAEVQAKAQTDAMKAQQDAQNARQAAQDSMSVEQYKIDRQMELERFKAELDAQTRLQIAEMQVRTQAAVASMRQVDGNPNNGEMRQ